MTVKIEKIAMTDARGKHSKNGAIPMPEFVAALKELKPGYSFLAQFISANHRIVISAIQHWAGCRFSTRKQPDGTFRVGRIL